MLYECANKKGLISYFIVFIWIVALKCRVQQCIVVSQSFSRKSFLFYLFISFSISFSLSIYFLSLYVLSIAFRCLYLSKLFPFVYFSFWPISLFALHLFCSLFLFALLIYFAFYFFWLFISIYRFLVLSVFLSISISFLFSMYNLFALFVSIFLHSIFPLSFQCSFTMFIKIL